MIGCLLMGFMVSWSYLLINNNLGLNLIQNSVGDNNMQFYLGIRICTKVMMKLCPWSAYRGCIPWMHGKSMPMVVVVNQIFNCMTYRFELSMERDVVPN